MLSAGRIEFSLQILDLDPLDSARRALPDLDPRSKSEIKIRVVILSLEWVAQTDVAQVREVI